MCLQDFYSVYFTLSILKLPLPVEVEFSECRNHEQKASLWVCACLSFAFTAEGNRGVIVLRADLGHQDVLFGSSVWKPYRAETHATPLVLFLGHLCISRAEVRSDTIVVWRLSIY